uniref:S4 RNA-binding domain-containing protein n=1 Tax=Steinernema glaseri TaxID=37863 RepID=A0A1I7Z665_9BILA
MRRVLTLATRSTRLLLESAARRPSAVFATSNRCFVTPSASLLARKQPPKKSAVRFSDEDDEEEEQTLEDGLPKDYKLKTVKLGSRRLDTLVNRAAGKSSSQVEKLILGGKVRVNDDPVTKKSYNVQKHDEIDVWIAPYEENNELAEVLRVEVVDYKITDAGYEILVKTWQKMLVDNWRGGSS